MPLFPYYCHQDHETERWVVHAADAPDTIPCEVCHCKAIRGVGVPNTRFGWKPSVIDSAKEFWDGTALADHDGRNRVHYKSKKLFSDGGKHASNS